MTTIPVTFSGIRSKTALSKRFELVDGTITKKPAAQMYEGAAHRIEIGFAEIPALLDRLSANEAIALGTFDPAHGARIDLTTAVRAGPGVYARTQEYFAFRGGPGLMMLDHDAPKDGSTAMSSCELIEALTRIVPEFSGCAMFVRGSVSTGVHEVGDDPLPGRGFHVYIPVADSTDIPRFGKALFERLWLAGHGRIELASNGAALVRTIIDGAVFMPERLDFVGRPIVGDGLAWTPPRVDYRDGGYLDTSTLTSLTDSEARSFAGLVAEAKVAARPAGERRHEAWREGQVERMISAGVKESTARQQVSRYTIDGTTFDLWPRHVLDFADGRTVTVADVLANPALFDDCALADPFEGPEYGTTTAKFYANPTGKPVINSQAHGAGVRYFLTRGDFDGIDASQISEPAANGHPEAPPPDDDEGWWDAALSAEGERMPDGGDGLSLEDFYALAPENKFIHRPTRALWSANAVDTRITARLTMKPSAWLARKRSVEQWTWWPGRPEIIKDMVVLEGGMQRHDGLKVYNQYHAPRHAAGNPAGAQRWLDHLRLIYPEDADHIIQWFAHRIQKPGEKINHALVLGSKSQGIGKDSILEPLKRGVGSWNFAEVSPAQMMGRFNGWLKAVVVRISEARDMGESDRFAFYDHSKAFLAAPPDTLRVDEKNAREYAIPNVCGVVITSNHLLDGLYLPAEDRRHYVAWSDAQREQFTADYWADFWTWLDGGGDADVIAYLATLDLSGFNAKAPPKKTEAFWAIVTANHSQGDGDLADVLDSLGNPDAVTLHMLARRAEQIERGDLANDLRDRRLSRQWPHRMGEAGYATVRNPCAADGRFNIEGRGCIAYASKKLTIRDQHRAVGELTAPRSRDSRDSREIYSARTLPHTLLVPPSSSLGEESVHARGECIGDRKSRESRGSRGKDSRIEPARESDIGEF